MKLTAKHGLTRTCTIFLALCPVLFLSACTITSQSAPRTNERIFNNSTSIFHSLKISEDEPVTVDLDVYLSETEAEFLSLEVSEDCKVSLDYTYSTRGQDGIILGYRHETASDHHSWQLAAAAEDAYGAISNSEILSLKKGMNHFYLSGDDRDCKMHLEIEISGSGEITYAGMQPPESTE